MYAVALIVAKLIGALYRIPLTNIIGAEGMGLYQMVFPLYTLLLTVSSGGLPPAVSRLVAVRLSAGQEKSANRVLIVAALFFAAVGLLGTLAVFMFSGQIAAAQGNAEARVAYIAVAPSVFFVALLSAFRGYFQGRQNMLPSALSQLVEQVLKLVLGIALSVALLPRGLEYAVLGALLGVSISEAAAFLVMLVIFLFIRRRDDRRHVRASRRALMFENAMELSPVLSPPGGLGAVALTPRLSAAERKESGVPRDRWTDILKEILKTALPVTFGSLILPITQVADSLLIINILSAVGVSAPEATALYGLYNGVTMAIINMPVVVVSAFSLTMMPRIVRLKETGKGLSPEVDYNLKLMLLISALFAVLLAVCGGDVVRVLYAKGLSSTEIALAATLLSLSAPVIICMCFIHVATAALQGVGNAATPALNLMFAAILKIALTAALLPALGIYGALIGTVACYLLCALLDMLSLRRRIGYRPALKPVLKLALAALAMTAVSLPAAFLLGKLSPFLRLLIAAVLGAAAFGAVILPLKYFAPHELRRLLPFADRRKKKYI